MALALDKDKFLTEINFKASLSGGAGGQHVNKVNTKVELRFDIDASNILTDEEKVTIKEKLANRINKDRVLLLTSQTERSQLKNKELVIERFIKMLEKALTPIKKRKATKPTKASQLKRLDEKHKQAEKKTGRKNVDL